MIKIVWLCNARFTLEKIKFTGSWLQPLAERLQKTGKVQIVNICRANVASVIKENDGRIIQYVLPIRKAQKYGHVPDKLTISEIIDIVSLEQPDLIHIWGTESIWAYMNPILSKSFKTIIDIQGLIAPYSDYYYGGLTNREIFQSIHLKELLMPTRTLYYKRKIFKDRGKQETKYLQTFTNISVQSNWVKNYIRFVAPHSKIYSTRIILRDGFYKAQPWTYKENKESPIIYSSCAAAVPYKGMHILIKAISLLKKKYPNIQLHLAGQINVGSRLIDGYSIYINKLVRKLGLRDNVYFLGSIDEDNIINELQKCNVCVVPSFIETYCLAFAESMIIGVPTVISYAGALPEFAEYNKDALFYNSIDYYTLAGYIDELIQNRELAQMISTNCRTKRFIENNQQMVVDNQLSIYQSILNKNDYVVI